MRERQGESQRRCGREKVGGEGERGVTEEEWVERVRMKKRGWRE